MNHSTTVRIYSLLNVKMLPVLFLLAVAFSSYSCAAQFQENLQAGFDSTETSGNGEETFTFHKMKDGKDNLWKAVFKDGKVVELYKNGTKIPNSEIKDYHELIDEELAELGPGHFHFPMRAFHFRFNPSELDSSMRQLRENISHMDFSWVDSAFNSKEFRSEMDSLRKNLHGLNGLRRHFPGKRDFYFDTSAFNKSMRELRMNLPKMGMYRHYFACDSAFRKDMKKFREKMKSGYFNKDEFRKEMKHFEKQMRKFDERMKKFYKEMDRSRYPKPDSASSR